MEYSFNTSLGYLASSISKNIGKFLVNQLKEKEIDVSADEWYVISMLYQKKICTQNQIVESSGQNKVKITRVIDTLELKKMIIRDVSKVDMRYKNVELTKYGIELYFKILPYANKTLGKALSGFDKGETDLMLDFCKRINKNLKEI